MIRNELNEAAWGISRGVRPLAQAAAGRISSLPEGGLNWLAKIVEEQSYPGVHKAILVVEDCYEVFYAAEEWVLDLYLWSCSKEVPEKHSEAILGILLGYSPYAIAAYINREGEYARATLSPPKPVKIHMWGKKDV